MRLIPGSECLRVYSILGTRPFRNSGAGAGAGISDSRWDPRHLSGCQLMSCTNTAAFGAGAVGFPADPVTNGGFETGDPPTDWLAAGGGTLSQVADAAPGSSGTKALNLHGAQYSNGYEVKLTIGNTYRIAGYGRSVDGSGVPALFDAGATWWTGTTSTNWQAFDVTRVAAGTRVGLYQFGAGTFDVRFDDVTCQCLNSSQLSDLTGLGHHLVQATPASQPLWVASGSGGVLRFDGAADYIKAGAFALNQPEHVFLLAKWTKQGTARYLIDGNGTNSMGVYHSAANTTIRIYAGTELAGPTFTDATWGTVDCVFSGNASAVGYNGGAQTVGDANTGNAGGVTLGTVGAGTAAFCAVADVAAVIVYNRALSEAERQRVIRWMNRQKAMLAL